MPSGQPARGVADVTDHKRCVFTEGTDSKFQGSDHRHPVSILHSFPIIAYNEILFCFYKHQHTALRPEEWRAEWKVMGSSWLESSCYVRRVWGSPQNPQRPGQPHQRVTLCTQHGPDGDMIVQTMCRRRWLLSPSRPCCVQMQAGEVLLTRARSFGDWLPSYTFTVSKMGCMGHFIFLMSIGPDFLGARDTRTRQQQGCKQGGAQSHHWSRCCVKLGTTVGGLAAFLELDVGWFKKKITQMQNRLHKTLRFQWVLDTCIYVQKVSRRIKKKLLTLVASDRW